MVITCEAFQLETSYARRNHHSPCKLRMKPTEIEINEIWSFHTGYGKYYFKIMSFDGEQVKMLMYHEHLCRFVSSHQYHRGSLLQDTSWGFVTPDEFEVLQVHQS